MGGTVDHITRGCVAREFFRLRIIDITGEAGILPRGQGVLSIHFGLTFAGESELIGRDVSTNKGKGQSLLETLAASISPRLLYDTDFLLKQCIANDTLLSWTSSPVVSYQ
jgi:hypothetical protein